MLVAISITSILTGVLALWAAWFSLADRAVILKQLIVGGVVVLSLVAQVVVGLVATAQGYALADPLTFWGYMTTAVVLLPVAGAWAFADRSRWSSVVLLVACSAILAMQAREWQLWTA